MITRRIPLAVIVMLLGLTRVWSGDARMTIYNQNFAVVRQQVPLDLKNGVNRIQFSGVTAYVEPDSVILRDPAGQFPFRILEQNYRADPVSESSLLRLYEGKVIDFLVQQNGHNETVRGKIIRSGYTPANVPNYYPQNPANFSQQPLVEVNGKLQFSLPGQPLFPALAPGSILQPVLTWLIETARPGRLNAELSYVTQGLDWEATYNVVQGATSQALDLVGWVTIHNTSGETFENTRIKLMAGTVNKLQPAYGIVGGAPYGVAGGVGGGVFGQLGSAPPVTQSPFDEYHLYDLHRAVTLRNRETKQLEFIRESGIQATRYYVYDGLRIDPNQYNGWNPDMLRQDRGLGTLNRHTISVMRKIVNSQANHLGVPLPAGRMRFYRQDQDGNLEFLGENQIKHTPADETLRIVTGNAFDLTGERRRTNFTVDMARNMADESFEIRLRNHKSKPVEIRVVEHLYRGDSWEISQNSNAFVKMDSHTIEFRVQTPPGGEKILTYTAHYTW